MGDGDREGKDASSGCVNEQVTNRGNWASVPLAGLCWNGSDGFTRASCVNLSPALSSVASVVNLNSATVGVLHHRN